MLIPLALFMDELSSYEHWRSALHKGGLSKPPFVSTQVADLVAAERLIIVSQSPLPSTLALFARYQIATVIKQRLEKQKPTLLVGTAVHAALVGGGQFDWLGLGALPGVLRRFQPQVNDTGERVKTPHVGWNHLHSLPPHPLWAGIQERASVYFAHQYFVDEVPRESQLALTQHGIYFPSVFYRQSLCAVQFRPEVSAHTGAQFLENFLRWRP